MNIGYHMNFNHLGKGSKGSCVPEPDSMHRKRGRFLSLAGKEDKILRSLKQ